MKLVGVFFTLFSVVFGFEWDTDFSYSNQGAWGSACRKKQQSPIPLSQDIVTINNSMSIEFSDGYLKPVNGTVSHIKVTVEAKLLDNSKHFIIVDRKNKFFFGAAYLHWPSEHTIEGYRYPLETQLVHYKSGFDSWEQAVTTPGAVFVISILHNLSDLDNLIFDPLVKLNPSLSNTLFKPIPARGIIGGILPKFDKSFYRYFGSLPIPNCLETLIWQVYSKPSTVSKEQLEVIKNIYLENGKKVVRTNRDIQKINGRTIYFKKDKK